MRRLALVLAMAFSCILVAITVVIIERTAGVSLFRIFVLLVVPIGAIGCGMAGASGAVFTAWYFNIKPRIFDAFAMVLVAAATMCLIYYVEYSTLVLRDGRMASELVGFKNYLDIISTTTHLRIGRTFVDVGEVGRAGYYLAALEFIGFLAGGAFTFFLIKELPECAQCGAYTRKIKSKSTRPLTFAETKDVLEAFQRTDLETMPKLLAWQPEARKLDDKSEKAIVTYDLLGCPKCNSEAIVMSVKISKGKHWKHAPSLKRRRNVDAK